MHNFLFFALRKGYFFFNTEMSQIKSNILKPSYKLLLIKQMVNKTSEHIRVCHFLKAILEGPKFLEISVTLREGRVGSKFLASIRHQACIG